MRLADRYLLVLGVLGIVGAAAWAMVGGPFAAVASVLVIGLLLAVADIGLWVATERMPGDLVVPAGLGPVQPLTGGGRRVRLPTPAWWWPTLFVGVLAVGAGYVADLVWYAVAGAALVLVALAALAAATRRRGAREDSAESAAGGAVGSASVGANELRDRRVVRDARNVRRFVAAHPARDGQQGTARGFVVDLGRQGVKLVVVAADGEFGDLVTASPERARLAAQLAGVTLEEAIDGAVGRAMRTGEPVWRGMARGRVQA